MRAKNRARPLWPLPEDNAGKARPVVAAAPKVSLKPALVPPLGLAALSSDSHPRRFVRVPTHAVGVLPEHREYPRATLQLPLRLRSVNNVPEEFPVTLVTRDVSSTGVYFLCPRPLAIGASLEIDIVLVSKPMGSARAFLPSRAPASPSEIPATS